MIDRVGYLTANVSLELSDVEPTAFIRDKICCFVSLVMNLTI